MMPRWTSEVPSSIVLPRDRIRQSYSTQNQKCQFRVRFELFQLTPAEAQHGFNLIGRAVPQIYPYDLSVARRRQSCAV